jgi:regulator of replication initiation timing
MREKEILTILSDISRKLDKGERHIKKNEWDDVGTLFSEINALHEKVRKNDPPIKRLMAENPSFKEQYEPLREILLEKTTRVISVIEQWKSEQADKITGSKNLLDNISKYYKPSNSSYYIDTNE